MSRPTITLRKPVERGLWVVWRPGTSRVRKRHDTEDSAWTEAARLAKEFPGATFYVCKAIGQRGPVLRDATARQLRGEP